MQEYTDFIASEWPLFVALAIVLVMLGRAFMTGVKSLTPFEAVTMMNHKNAVIVDVRTDDEYRSGHVANSLHIPLGMLRDRLGELQPYKDQPIIVACRSGARSASAVGILSKQGFETVYNLAGGVLAWGSSNLPLTTGQDAAKPAATPAS